MAEQDSPYPGDIVEARLEPGEFVLNKNLVEAIGVDTLEEMNDSVPRFSQSAHRMGRARGMAEGGEAASGRRGLDRATRRYTNPAKRITPVKGVTASQKYDNIRGMHKSDADFSAWIDDMKKGRQRDLIAARGRVAVHAQREKSKDLQAGFKRYRLDQQMDKDMDALFKKHNPDLSDQGDVMGDYFKQKERDDSVGWRDYAHAKGQRYTGTDPGDTTQTAANMRQEAKAKANDWRSQAQNVSDRMRTDRGVKAREDELDVQAEQDIRASRSGAHTRAQDYMQKMSNLGLEGWEKGVPRDLVARQLASPDSGKHLEEYAKSILGSKDKPLSREQILDKAGKIKGLVDAKANEMYGDSETQGWEDDTRAEVDTAKGKIDDAVNYALQGYQSPAEAARSKVQEAGTKGLKEKLMNYGQAKAGGLKKSLSTFAGSLLYGQSGGYVPHMAEGGFLGKLKSGLAGMKKRAGATDYHMNQAGADAATIDSGVQEWAGATEGKGSVGEFGGIGEGAFNQLNKGLSSGDEGWQSSEDVAASIRAQFAEGDAPDMELGSPDVQHKVGAGRAMAEKVSPLLQAGAKLGGQGIGMAGKAIAGGAGLIGQGFQAAKQDFQGEGSKIKKAAGFLGALTGEMASPGMLQQQRMLKELGMLNKGTGAKPPELPEDVGSGQATTTPAPQRTEAMGPEDELGDYATEMGLSREQAMEDAGNQSLWEQQAAEAEEPDGGYGGAFGDRNENWANLKGGLKSLWDRLGLEQKEKKLTQPSGAYGATTGSGQVMRNQRGGYVPQYYQDGGYVSPQNNTRRLLNQARNRYGRNS